MPQQEERQTLSKDLCFKSRSLNIPTDKVQRHEHPTENYQRENRLVVARSGGRGRRRQVGFEEKWELLIVQGFFQGGQKYSGVSV